MDWRLGAGVRKISAESRCENVETSFSLVRVKRADSCGIHQKKPEYENVAEIAGVMPNPTLAKLYEGVEIAKSHQADLLLIKREKG